MEPDLDLLPPFYKRYAEQVKNFDIEQALHYSIDQMLTTYNTIQEDKGEHRYQPDKWSIKELLCHVIDTERIFAYRALTFSRNDKTSLPGFEENDYAPEANANARTLNEISEEMKNLRKSSIDLYKSFTAEMIDRNGLANGLEISVKNQLYLISGHMLHHRQILVERYL
jgi:uncharacterized damage-inducible protein DinB